MDGMKGNQRDKLQFQARRDARQRRGNRIGNGKKEARKGQRTLRSSYGVQEVQATQSST